MCVRLKTTEKEAVGDAVILNESAPATLCMGPLRQPRGPSFMAFFVISVFIKFDLFALKRRRKRIIIYATSNPHRAK